jgi:hypothetical protein
MSLLVVIASTFLPRCFPPKYQGLWWSLDSVQDTRSIESSDLQIGSSVPSLSTSEPTVVKAPGIPSPNAVSRIFLRAFSRCGEFVTTRSRDGVSSSPVAKYAA